MEMIEKVILSMKQHFSSCFHVQMLSITDRGRTFLCSLSLITSEKKRKADDSKEMFKVRLKSYSEADLNTEQNILNTCNELSKHYFIFLLFLKIVSEVPEVRNHHFKHHKGNTLCFVSVKLIEPFQLACTNLIVLDRFHVCEQKVRFWP